MRAVLPTAPKMEKLCPEAHGLCRRVLRGVSPLPTARQDRELAFRDTQSPLNACSCAFCLADSSQRRDLRPGAHSFCRCVPRSTASLSMALGRGACTLKRIASTDWALGRVSGRCCVRALLDNDRRLTNRAANNRGQADPLLVSHPFDPRGKAAPQKADRELVI